MLVSNHAEQPLVYILFERREEETFSPFLAGRAVELGAFHVHSRSPKRLHFKWLSATLRLFTWHPQPTLQTDLHYNVEGICPKEDHRFAVDDAQMP